MKRTAYFALVFAVVAAIAFALAGCGGTKVAGVPDKVATVDGQQIPASQYLDLTSQRAGRQVLSSLIEQNILLAWAKEEKVEPKEEQINKQIEALKRDGYYADQVKMLGEDQLKFEIKAMQARINLMKKDTKITDAELEQAFANPMINRRYVHGPRKQVELMVNSDKSRLEEAEKAIKGGGDFEKIGLEYSDPKMVASGNLPKIWIEENQPGLPPSLASATKDAKLNETSKIFSVSQPSQPTQFVLLKVVAEQGKLDLKLKDVKEEVEDAVVMQKGMMSGDFQKKFDEKKKNAKIEINIDRFGDLVNTFKNPQEPQMPMMAPAPKAAPQAAPKAAPAK